MWVSYRCFEFLPQPSYTLVRWSWRERSWRGPLFWCGFIFNYNDMQRIESIPSLPLMFVLLPSKFMLLMCENQTMRWCPLFVSNLLITFIQLLNSSFTISLIIFLDFRVWHLQSIELQNYSAGSLSWAVVIIYRVALVYWALLIPAGATLGWIFVWIDALCFQLLQTESMLRPGHQMNPILSETIHSFLFPTSTDSSHLTQFPHKPKISRQNVKKFGFCLFSWRL